MTKQVVEGLQYVHASGFVHGDLKPENVLLTGRHAKLCDFGLAGRAGQLRVGPAAGTTMYMSPELVAVRRGVEYRVSIADDIWSLAILLYTVIFAAHPWEEATGKDERYLEFVYDDAVMEQPPWSAVPTPLRRCLIAMLEGADRRPRLEHIAEVLDGPWPGEAQELSVRDVEEVEGDDASSVVSVAPTTQLTRRHTLP